MTTIIATANALYSDSLITDTAVAFQSNKLYRIGTSIIGASGDTGLINGWLEARRKHRKYKIPKDWPEKDKEISVIVVNKKGIWMIEEDMSEDKVNEPFIAIGSGALAACGALRQQSITQNVSPEFTKYDFKTAIEIAARYDEATRLPMQVLYLDPKRTA